MVAALDLGSSVVRRGGSSPSWVTQKKMKLHFIWVGENETPQPFLSNLEKVKVANPGLEFMEWNDSNLVQILEKYGRKEEYLNSSIFHKLQLARYTVLDLYGGLYSDYDIYWNFPIVQALGERIDSDMVFTQRRSLYFYKNNREIEKLKLLDDYLIYAKPGLTSSFLDFCLERSRQKERLKDDSTEPYSVYALTEWIRESHFDIKYFSEEEIYHDGPCTIAKHDNKKTWNN